MARGQHTTFAHDILRDSALADPLFFLWAAHRDDAVERFSNIWEKCASAGEPCAPDGLHIEVVGSGPVYFALITMPKAQEVIEAHFAAALVVVPEEILADVEAQAADVPAKDRLERCLKVIVGSTTPEVRSGWAVPVRYFTLEHGINLDETPRTVLCEWVMHETGPRHENFGDGPEATAEAFMHAVTSLLLQSTQAGEA